MCVCVCVCVCRQYTAPRSNLVEKDATVRHRKLLNAEFIYIYMHIYMYIYIHTKMYSDVYT